MGFCFLCPYLYINEFGIIVLCSTSSLKLAVSRIKILKNKREAVVKQLRRDIAHLIEIGEEQTAQLQVQTKTSIRINIKKIFELFWNF